MIADPGMTRTISLILLALVSSVLGFVVTDIARAQTTGRATNTNSAPTDLSAQSRPARARTRIRVVPAYPYRLYSTTYPVPYKYDFPGPGAVRQCTSWLTPENRASGPVIVPKMRCWWER
jgi:hypothetical protein